MTTAMQVANAVITVLLVALLLAHVWAVIVERRDADR